MLCKILFKISSDLFQPEKKGFTIFCDENAGVSQPRPVLPKSAAPALVDKENVAPAFPRVPTMFRAPAPILGSFKTVESFSDDSSDMEMDNTLDTSPCELESPAPGPAQARGR